MSHVTCQMSQFFFVFLIKWWTLSVEGLLSTGPTPSSFDRLGRITLSKNFSSLALTVWEWRFVEDIFTQDKWLNASLNDKGVCRTAPATEGLVIYSLARDLTSPGGGLGKNHYFVNSEILGMHIWRNKRVNYNKFEIATNCVNKIFNQNAFFASFWQVLHDITILLPNIYIFCIIYRLWRWHL